MAVLVLLFSPLAPELNAHTDMQKTWCLSITLRITCIWHLVLKGCYRIVLQTLYVKSMFVHACVCAPFTFSENMA